MIDRNGYRPNVGIILCNQDNKVLWARRINHDGWQFPQGGVRKDETPDDAMYRELYEEVGLEERHVILLARTRDWLRYDLPWLNKHSNRAGFRGQKQIWYLLRLTGSDDDVCLDMSDKPEFDSWRWVHYWQPLKQVVHFKRDVYRAALKELESYLGKP